jgi:NADH-quinone oxidoreductase subunit N
MSLLELQALSPLLALTATILVVLMIISFSRSHRLVCVTTVIGLLVTLASVPCVIGIDPVQVTQLLVIDQFALLFITLISLVTIAVSLLAYGYFDGNSGQHEEFYLLLMLSALGAMVLVCCTHFASFLLGLELLSISLYALISYPTRGLIPLEAAVKYLILSGVASATLLMGAALVYAGLGTLSFEQLGSGGFHPEATAVQAYVVIGSAMLLTGLAFKLSLVPFHMWTPDVYEGAPAPVTAFVATISKGAIFALMVRFFVLTGAFEYQSILIGLSVFAIGSMLIGNLLALLQNNVKRMFAYSSIAHIGYLLVAFISGGISGGMPLALEASIFFLVAYIATTLGAFGIVSILSSSDDSRDCDNLENYTGLFWRRPALAGVFSIVLFSLAGIPLTAGFIGKFYIVAAGVKGTLWLLMATLVVGSGIGLYYYLRVIFTMTLKSTPTESVRTPMAGGFVMLLVTAAILTLGVYPGPFIDMLGDLAKSLT